MAKKNKKKKLYVARGENVLVTKIKKKKNNAVNKLIGNGGGTIGSFGNLVFQVSSKSVLTPKNIKQDISGEWGVHSVLGKKPKSEFQGPALRQMTFDIVIDAMMGQKPHSVIKKMHKMVEEGKVDIFMLGIHKIGKGKWKMEKVSDEFGLIYSAGELIRASVSVTLSEYF